MRSWVSLGLCLALFALAACSRTPHVQPTPVVPAAEGANQVIVPLFGYEDKDGDNVNDLFRDADGDGMCDVTGLAYMHIFPYEDADGDGKNDYFQDANGNGINDLFRPGKRIGNYVLIFHLDADDDGRNDVTGRYLPGHRLGRPFRRAADSLENDPVNPVTGSK